MTVQTNTNVASFNGNGVTQIFPIAFKFNNDTDLVVLLVDDATGSASLLTLNSDYTVSGEGDEEGGLINVVVAPATGKRLKVTRVVDILQLTDLRNQGKFFAEIHEDALDLLTMIAQQHESGINSSLRVAESDPEPARIPAVAQRANKILSFDAAGNPQVVAPVNDSSTELRQQLADGITDGDGAALIGRATVAIDSISALLSAKQDASQLLEVKSYHGGWAALLTGPIGGGTFTWVSSRSKADHNGGTVIDPTAPFPASWSDQTQLAAWFDSANAGSGCWVRVYSGTIHSEWFGAFGDATTNDTIALNALLSSAMDKQRVQFYPATYSVVGTLLLADKADVCVDFNNAKIVQGQTFAKLFHALRCTGLTIEGGRLQGLGGAAGEWTTGSDSPDWNGVAGILIDECTDVLVTRNRVVDFAGTGIRWNDSDNVRVIDNDVIGIGSTYIAENDNGNGFAVGGPVDDLTRRDYTFEVRDNRLSGHSFGIFANRIGSMHIQGNTITDIPGQHGIYLIESNNTTIIGNIFKEIAGQGIKTQNENYVGRGVAPAGGDIDTVNMVIADNNINGCASGIVMLTAPMYYPHDQFFDNVSITNNVITNCRVNDGLILQRVKGVVTGNVLADVVRQGINLQACALTIQKNQIKRAVVNGIFGDLFDDSEIHGNTFVDCGTANPNSIAGGGTPIYIQAIAAANFSTTPPAEYVVSFEANRIRFTSGDAAATSLVACLDSRGSVEVFDTRTNSALPFRAGGRVIASGGNLFKGFFDGADNAPAAPKQGCGTLEFYGNANPATAGLTQSFRRGDKCWNSNPSATGQPVGWVCITAGSPGTWASFGAIS